MITEVKKTTTNLPLVPFDNNQQSRAPINNSTFTEYRELYIPELIDIERICTNNPPDEITLNAGKPYIILDKMVWLLAQIVNSQRSQKAKGLKLVEGWAPLYSRIPQSGVHNYRQYLDYLLRVGVIECDESYSNHSSKHESKKYRIHEEYYNRKLKCHIIFTKKLIQANRNSIESEDVKEEYSYLTKWFDGLTCDMLEAKEILQQRYTQDEIEVQRQLSIIQERINRGYGRFSITTSNRLTTPICNLPKECRKALRYEDSRLVELDIKNSIPFMSLALLNNKILAKNVEICKIIESSNEYLSSGYIKLKKYKEKESIEDSYMLVETSKVVSEYNDIDLYKEKVVDSTIYEYIAEHWNMALNTNYDRNEAKKKFLAILNSPSTFESKERTVLITLLPNVMNVFDFINTGYIKTNRMKGTGEWNTNVDGQKCPFAIITQKIEAWFVLERVCQRITNELPLAPLFTIHDAIYTTDTFVDDIETIIHTEFISVFGVDGSVSKTYY